MKNPAREAGQAGAGTPNGILPCGSPLDRLPIHSRRDLLTAYLDTVDALREHVRLALMARGGTSRNPNDSTASTLFEALTDADGFTGFINDLTAAAPLNDTSTLENAVAVKVKLETALTLNALESRRSVGDAA